MAVKLAHSFTPSTEAEKGSPFSPIFLPHTCPRKPIFYAAKLQQFAGPQLAVHKFNLQVLT